MGAQGQSIANPTWRVELEAHPIMIKAASRLAISKMGLD